MKSILLLLLTVLLAARSNAQTTIRLTQVPAQTPKAATLYLAGSCNNWNPGSEAYAFTKTSSGTYQLTLPATLIGTLDFKITRGTWPTAEADAQHQDIANRQYVIDKKAATLELQVASWKDSGGASGQVACTSTALKPQVQVLDSAFEMPQLQRKRRIWLYLPLDYAASSNKRYPVLYLHDGQNVFDACTGFSGEWGVDEALSQLQQKALDTGSIVVAVDNGGDQRLNELSPWRNAEYGGGQGDQYVDFMVETLKPYIDAHYRTLTGREFTGIAGSSMGGLISTYAALKYPQVYSKVGVFSPAFWFAKQPLFEYVRQHPANPGTRFYFVSGTTESETMAPLMQAMRDSLQRNGVPAANLAYSTPPDGKHAEWFWKREFPAAYSWLYQLGAASNSDKGPRPLPYSAALNQAQNQLALQLPEGTRKARLEIFDQAGRVVLKKKARTRTGVAVGHLPKGNYLLRVSAGKQTGSQTLVKR
ncbi:alpha/beta hydrolase-fold protein [Hymenobacter gelipurpurascens]|uniref:alpha/beta hydrolase-fold protein n=1 Tax=Hymenobacter gelipurpurascens TaxID=89968 RepID=UPI001131ECCB|nr:alpha/beta hydrolase-fold protein [Hymenobacter gelipurpurascens]